jgi:glutamate dehydrogenase
MAREPVPHIEHIVEQLETGGDQSHSGAIATFARAYLRRFTDEWSAALPPTEMAAQITNLFEFVDRRRSDAIAVRVFNPTIDECGYDLPGAVVEIVADDRPFLIDSVSNAIQKQGFDVERVLHPVIGTRRDADGRILDVLPARSADQRESVQHVELNRPASGSAVEELETAVRRALEDTLAAVRDFEHMQVAARSMVRYAREGAARYSAEEIEDAGSFLEWLLDFNFVFLGYREYKIIEQSEGPALQIVEGSGLGILTDDSTSDYRIPVPLADLPEDLRARHLDGELVVITKTNRKSTVHRPDRMDYIGLRRVNESGEIVGEARLLGLFTSSAYMAPASSIPMLKRKLQHIIEAEDLIEGSHDYKQLVQIFDSFPKDELFSTPTDEIGLNIIGLVNIEEHRHIRLFVRPDLFARSISVLVALPRDHFSAALRKKLGKLFMRKFGGTSSDFRLSLGETGSARIHFTIWVSGGTIPEVSFTELEAEVVALARNWEDRLIEHLSKRLGPEPGHHLAQKWAGRFPEYYRTSVPIALSVNDIIKLEELISSGDTVVIGLQNETEPGEQLTRLAVYRRTGKMQLSSIMPVLEALGLRVVEEVPTRISDGEGAAFIHDFGVLDSTGGQLNLDSCAARISEAVKAILEGEAESDSLNRLIVGSCLTHAEVGILRTYRAYWRRVSPTYTMRYINDTFAAHPDIAQLLVKLFDARFNPDAEEGLEPILVAQITEDLDALQSLEEDRILRGFLQLIQATVRTNAYRPGRQSLSFKFDSARVPDMPLPHPKYEIFVYAPEVEAIHLRGGMVARGGLRWSDRREDYRTEVLGLMKAQMTKNAIIVPTGSKGGFVLRQPPTDRAELRTAVEAAYSIFIRGMLDITDNLSEGEVVHPQDVRVHDGGDPYLVVAADKGTARLSDTANRIAGEYGYWLADAFASGGSAGYDHKALGITAKGAWESVKYHFWEDGVDVQTDPITVVGIGDMSGDVFGNGMLMSRSLKLVAAFDHRHIFIDPDPDPTASFAERQRIFDLPTSSWEDYDVSALSKGGGVYPRSAKSIDLSPEAKQVLDTGQGRFTPHELIKAVLQAPVDLLWNGGIGTYVKAKPESNVDVGDRPNDAVRINGRDLRCKVVVEGGNLGLTQRGRIEFAATGKINTDFIDNSGGVHCSDREVNLKILLSLAEERGELSREERDKAVASVAEDVVEAVLYDNFLQAQILSQEVEQSPRQMEAYEDLMSMLESAGVLDRILEAVPTAEELNDRTSKQLGLTRPELSVLLAYSKRSLAEALMTTGLPDEPHFSSDLHSYFPKAIQEKFGHLIEDHPLKRELVATILANQVINSEGITFVTRLMNETGSTPAEIVRAFRITREVSGASERWRAVEQLKAGVDIAMQRALLFGVDELVEALTRWYLTRPREESLTETIAETKTAFADLAKAISTVGPVLWSREREGAVEELMEAGVPKDIARRHVFQKELIHGPDIIELARHTGYPLLDVARVFFLIGQVFELDWLEDEVGQLPVATRWQRWAIQTLDDDLIRLRRDLASSVLLTINPADPDEMLAEYLHEHDDGLVRLRRFINKLSADGVDDAAMAVVAIRQVRAFVGTT